MIGNNNTMDKISVCESDLMILDKELVGRKPPAEITVNAKLKESNNLRLKTLNRKIIKIVIKK